MATGDIGGVITELVITCMTAPEGAISIAKGDALKLAGDYVVTNATSDEDAVFGQAMANATDNESAIPVKVRGVCKFAYTGETAPTANGAAGIVASDTGGSVKAPASGNGKGINLKVDTSAKTVEVLL